MPPARRRPASARAPPPAKQGGARPSRGPVAQRAPQAAERRASQGDSLASSSGAAAGPDASFRYVAPRSKARGASPSGPPDHPLQALALSGFAPPRSKARAKSPCELGNSPVHTWIQTALAMTPPQVQPRGPHGYLSHEFEAAGITGPWDLQGMDHREIRTVFPFLEACSTDFLTSLQRAPSRSERLQLTVKRVGPEGAPQDAEAIGAHVAPARAALQVLAAARRDKHMLAPDTLADAVVALAKLPAVGLQALQDANFGVVPERPGDRAVWLEMHGGMGTTRAIQELIVREIRSWHRSGFKYVSPVRLWGRVAAGMKEAPWPPTEVVLGAFAFTVRNGNTLMKYVSQIRSVLRLVSIPLGVLEDTAALARGAAKSSEPRFKARASAKQTRNLTRYIRNTLGEHVIADSFVVARQFCLRYASEVLPLARDSAHSSVRISDGPGVAEATVIFHSRKGCKDAVAVVRRCICAMQTPELCGVCVLKKCTSQTLFFPGVSYGAALATLKIAAMALGFPKAESWGTHAFRRGWADEALAHGGVPALFFSGGWRGVAAFGYASAQAKGSVQAAEWLVEFTESSGSD